MGMATQVGSVLHAQRICPLSSSSSSAAAATVQSLGVPVARVPLLLNPGRVSFARRCATAVRANSPSASGGTGDAGAATPSSTTAKKSSILCQSCDGNGAVSCSQCHGGGVNTEDHFNGRFKVGATCWLCRGKRQMLCGNCNGAGFMGGFMNTQDE